MNLLKRNNWFIVMLLNIITFGFFNFILASFMKLYDKDAWYFKWPYWVFGGITLILPAIIMLIVFNIQMTCKIALKLGISGHKIYNVPYSWVLFIIIPILGWTMLIIMYLYIEIMIIVKLFQGYAEK